MKKLLSITFILILIFTMSSCTEKNRLSINQKSNLDSIFIDPGIQNCGSYFEVNKNGKTLYTSNNETFKYCKVIKKKIPNSRYTAYVKVLTNDKDISFSDISSSDYYIVPNYNFKNTRIILKGYIL